MTSNHRCASLIISLMVIVGVGCNPEMSTDTVGLTETDERIARVESGLCRPLMIEGEPEQRFSLEERMDEFAVPAVSVAVIDAGEVAWARAWGVHEVGGDEVVSTDTMFQAGSVSKPVAALLALSLVSSGELELDRPVNEVLRSWSVPENELTLRVPVTLRHLMSHQAGLTKHTYVIPRSEASMPGMADLLQGGIRDWPAVKVEHLPGSEYAYSNSAYCVLQLALEDVSGLSLHQLAQQRLFAPLGMLHSRFDDPLPPEVLAAAAKGHRPAPADADGRRAPNRVEKVPGTSLQRYDVKSERNKSDLGL